jgi:hypothetical protein
VVSFVLEGNWLRESNWLVLRNVYLGWAQSHLIVVFHGRVEFGYFDVVIVFTFVCLFGLFFGQVG